MKGVCSVMIRSVEEMSLSLSHSVRYWLGGMYVFCSSFICSRYTKQLRDERTSCFNQRPCLQHCCPPETSRRCIHIAGTPVARKWPVLTFPMLYALARMFTWPKRTTSEGDIALQKEGPIVA